MMHIETAGRDTFSMNWFEDGVRQRETFTAAYFAAAKLTRERATPVCDSLMLRLTYGLRLWSPKFGG
jgi:hypothetical protein